MRCRNPKCQAEFPDTAAACPECGVTVLVVGAVADTTLFDLKPDIVLSGRFQLVRRLGSGGMGDVWLARDQTLGEDIAVKVLKADLVADDRAVLALQKEVSVTRKLRHPNIVGVYDYHAADGVHYITMEYAEGASAADVLTKAMRAGNHGLPLDQAITIARHAARALDFAHSEGVLHRDVKPANILWLKDGRVKLADFGIARVAKDTRTRVTGEITSGTLMYMSPEQLMNEKPDARSDQYSLACSVYEMLSGNPPFYSGAVQTQIQLKAPEPIEGVPVHVNTALLKALAKRREDRFGSCRDFAKSLADEKGIEPKSETPDIQAPNLVKDHQSTTQDPLQQSIELSIIRSPLRRAMRWIVGGCIFAAIALVVYFGATNGHGGQTPPPASPDKPNRTSQPPTSPQQEPDEQPGGASPAASQPQSPTSELTPVTVQKFANIEFCWIPAGTLMMGSPKSEKGRSSDEVQREVPIEGFWLGRYEVTQEQWQAEMGSNPSNFKGEKLPVETVSWYECQDFINKLNRKGTGHFRLPTEAEWEYACRAGTHTAYSFGDDELRLKDHAWYGLNSEGKTHIVGQKQPNAWKLHDMTGNVWEWCEDLYGVGTGQFRVMRGGSWYSTSELCRAAVRNSDTPGYRGDRIGFRLLQTRFSPTLLPARSAVKTGIESP